MGSEPEVEGGVTGTTDGPVTEQSEGVIQVPQRRLDDLIEGPVSFMKVDIEGVEMWAFQGAESLLVSQEIKRICFEYNPVRADRLGIEKEEPVEFLGRHGYDITEKDYGLCARPRN